MMCAKKWNVEKELASHLVIALSSMNVNAISGGVGLVLSLLTLMIISSFFLAWFPIVRYVSISVSVFLVNPSGHALFFQ